LGVCDWLLLSEEKGSFDGLPFPSGPVLKQQKTEICRDGKTRMCLLSRSGKESALPQLLFFNI
jgi:hypothetical protein